MSYIIIFFVILFFVDVVLIQASQSNSLLSTPSFKKAIPTNIPTIAVHGLDETQLSRIFLQKINSITSSNGAPMKISEFLLTENFQKIFYSNFVYIFSENTKPRHLEFVLNQLQLLFDTASYKKQQINIYIILDSKFENQIKPFLETLKTLSLKNKKNIFQTDFVTVEIVKSEDIDQLSTEGLLRSQIKSPISNSIMTTQKSNNIKQIMSDNREISSIEVGSSLLASFQEILLTKLSDLPITLNITDMKNQLEESISDISWDHYEANQPLYEEYFNTSGLAIASNNARNILQNKIYSTCQFISLNIKNGLIDNFETQLTKINGGTTPENITKQLVDLLSQHYTKLMNELTSAFSSIVSKDYQVSLLSKEYATSRLHPLHTSNYYIEALKLDISRNKVDFLQHMDQHCKEHIDNLFLLGAINPYMRLLPFPPTHLNFNYLINTKEYTSWREFNQMYDEHKEGLCLNRADALKFPQIANIPFDPLENLKSDNRPSFWTQLKEYFN